MPKPIAPNSGAPSSTRTVKPWRANANAVVKPPSPPPAIMMGSFRSIRTRLLTNPQSLIYSLLCGPMRYIWRRASRTGTRDGNFRRRPEHPRRTRAQGFVAGQLDHPLREPCAREWRWSEGRRPPSLICLARHHHDGALFLHLAAAGSRCGEAARLAEFSRDSISARQADAREAGKLSRLPRCAIVPLAPQGYG